VYIHAVVIWFAILVVAIANGAVRVDLLIPRFGEELGHVLSTISLCVAIYAVTWASIPWIGASSRNDALGVGLLWVAMTVAFEFLGGHYLFGTPWPELLADYNVVRGRIWILVLLTTAVAPALAAYARGLFTPNA
jgi:hypothetical protein